MKFRRRGRVAEDDKPRLSQPTEWNLNQLKPPSVMLTVSGSFPPQYLNESRKSRPIDSRKQSRQQREQDGSSITRHRARDQRRKKRDFPDPAEPDLSTTSRCSTMSGKFMAPYESSFPYPAGGTGCIKVKPRGVRRIPSQII